MKMLEQDEAGHGRPRKAGAALAAFWCLFLLAGDVQAYVDGGTGLMLIQGLLALIGGVLYFVRNPVKAYREWRERRKGGGK